MGKLLKFIIGFITLAAIGATGFILYGNTSKDTPKIGLAENPQLHQSSGEFSQFLKEAATYANEKNYKAAVEKYLAANNANPDSNLPYFGLARIYLMVERFDLAEENLAKGAKKGSMDLMAKNMYLRVLIQKKEFTKARELYQTINTPNTETKLLATIFKLLLRDQKNAEKELNELVAVEAPGDKYVKIGHEIKSTFDVYQTFTDSPQSYLFTLVGQKLIDSDEYVLARPLLFAGIEEQNDYRDAWLLLGYSLLNSNKYEDAKQALEKASQMDPYFADTYFYLGLAKQKLKEYKSAVESYAQADGFNYSNKFKLYTNLANSYYELKEFSLANDYFTLASQAGTLSIGEYTRIVQINIDELKNLSQALNMAQTALIKYPENAAALNLLGWAQYANSQYSESRISLEAALKLNPNFESAHLNLGFTANAEGKTDEAILHINEAIKLAKQFKNEAIEQKAIKALKNLNQ